MATVGRRVTTRCGALAVLSVLAVLLSACGGGTEESAGAVTSTSVAARDGADTGDGFTVSSGDAEVVVGGTNERPVWLPTWVELPNGLEITTQFNSPGLGESAVMGVIEGEDQEELLAEALILVQSNGYVIGEQYDTPSGKGFNADHSSDGTRIVFGVGEFVEGSALWSMEFYAGKSDDGGDQQVANEAPTSRYDTPGVMTVTVGGQMFEVIGSCELSDGYGTFQADDGRSVFDVFQRAESGGLGAVGGASLVVDGEVVTGWNVFQSMEIVDLQLTDDSIYYEGSMLEATVDSEEETGTIDIDCS